MVKEIPLKRFSWERSCRLIPSRFPPVELYEQIAPVSDWDALKAIEGLTNPRNPPDGGGPAFLLPEDRHVTQPWMVAPFAYPSPEPTKFSDGSYGVCLLAQNEKGALIESVRRREAFLRSTSTPRTEIVMRLLIQPVSAHLHDLTGIGDAKSAEELRSISMQLRTDGSHGIVLPSRYRRGESIAALFRPTAMTSATQSTHYCFVWDGDRISKIYQYSTTNSDGEIDPTSLITESDRAAA